MPVVDAIVRRGDRGKRVTSGPNALEGPKASRSRSPFSSITRITGSTDFYEVTNPYGLAPGNYTIYVRPVNRNGLSLDGVGRVAVVKQAGGRDNPNATAALVALKRPNSVDSPLILGPFAVTTADRLFVVLERRGVAEVKYQLQLEGPNSALRDELWAKAGAVPSLDLRLATSKSLVDSVSGQSLVTFTRASSGTYVDADGLIKTAANDVPRFDHNPVTGESLGLLVEEQRTNLLRRSEEMDNTYWIKGGLTVTANQELAPDGTLTADTCTLTSFGHALYAFATVEASTTYTFSFYAKRGTGTSAVYAVTNDSAGGASIVSDTSYYSQTSTSTWSRISVTFTTPVSCTSIGVLLQRDSGSDSGTMFFWGAQLEAGAFPTSYIPTTDSAVTRSADVASISGSNFSSWFNVAEGAVFSDWSTSSSSEQMAWVISNGTLNESLRTATLVSAVSNNTRLVVLDNNSLQAGMAVGVYTPGSRRKTALAYQQDNFAGAADGAAVVTATSGTLPTVDRLFIGANWTGSGNFLGGPIRRLTFWPTRLSNSTLQAITQ